MLLNKLKSLFAIVKTLQNCLTILDATSERDLDIGFNGGIVQIKKNAHIDFGGLTVLK